MPVTSQTLNPQDFLASRMWSDLSHTPKNEGDTGAPDLYGDYLKWARENNILRLESKSWFGRKITGLYGNKIEKTSVWKHGKMVRGWFGLLDKNVLKP